MRAILIALLLLAAFPNAGFAQKTPEPGIEVALNDQDPLRLRVTLTSGAARTVTLYRSDLPWGNRYSMVFAAMKPNGEALELELPVDDPGPTKVSVQPKQPLTGEIDLRYVLRDASAVKKSDVLLFWAYRAPAELQIPRWLGGLVVIHQQK